MTSKGLNSIYPSAHDERIIPVFHKSADSIKMSHENEKKYYDSSIIENRKTVVVNLQFNNVTSANKYIFLEFIPNEVILKYVTSICVDPTSDSIISPITIKTDLGYLDNDNLITFTYTPQTINTVAPAAGDPIEYFNRFNSNTQVNIKLPNFVNKQYNFYLDNDIGNNTIDFANYITLVGLTFEFIKYKTTD